MKHFQWPWKPYHQTFNISDTLVGNKMADHSGVVGALPVGAAPTMFSYLTLHLTPGFNGLGRDNCKMRWETFKCWDLVWLILDVWQYIFHWNMKPWLLQKSIITEGYTIAVLIGIHAFTKIDWNGEFDIQVIDMWMYSPEVLTQAMHRNDTKDVNSDIFSQLHWHNDIYRTKDA